MIKIFKSLAIIVAVVAVAAGATYAVNMNDEAKMYGATFSVGTVDLKLDKDPVDDNNQNWVNSFTVPVNYYVDGLYPGFPTNAEKEHNWQVIDIKNVGDYSGKVTMKLQMTSEWNELANKLKFDVYYYDNETTFNPSMTKSVEKVSLSGLNNVVKDLGSLLKGKTHAVRIEWFVDESAGNEIQGDSVKFDVVFDLEHDPNLTVSEIEG